MHDLVGQWLSHFEYGPEYGEERIGEKVQFKIFIDTFNNNEFTGNCVELGGIGASDQTSLVRGFLKDSFISFTKAYPSAFYVDAGGNAVVDPSRPPHVVNYSGKYNYETQTFSGEWDIRLQTEASIFGKSQQVASGFWEMKKVS